MQKWAHSKRARASRGLKSSSPGLSSGYFPSISLVSSALKRSERATHLLPRWTSLSWPWGTLHIHFWAQVFRKKAKIRRHSSRHTVLRVVVRSSRIASGRFKLDRPIRAQGISGATNQEARGDRGDQSQRSARASTGSVYSHRSVAIQRLQGGGNWANLGQPPKGDRINKSNIWYQIYLKRK